MAARPPSSRAKTKLPGPATDSLPADFPKPRLLPQIRVVRGHVLTSAQIRAKKAAVLAVPVSPDPEGEGVQPGPGTADAGLRYGVDLAQVACRRSLKASAGSTLALDLPQVHASAGDKALPWTDLAPRLVLVGLGDGSPAALRRAGAALANEAKNGTVVTPIATDDRSMTAALVEGFWLGGYRRAKASQTSTDDRLGELVLLGRHDRSAIGQAQIRAQATMLARDLTNWPASTKTPASFAACASDLAAQTDSISVAVLDPDDLASQGFGAILAVGGGAGGGQGPGGYAGEGAGGTGPGHGLSQAQLRGIAKARRPGRAIDAPWADRTPRLVVARYQPATAGPVLKQPFHLVLVGKGITFDSGGLDIKPRASMSTMATDCAGAATALATVWAAAQLELPVRLTAVLALAENGFGAGAYRPGDVIKTYGGRTVEVADTDAEGRLVLADGLGFAATLAADATVTLATLTGAARLALGEQTSALFANDDALASAFEQAAESAGEAIWRLPLVEDYLPSLDSQLADCLQLPAKPRGGGAITAALFLRQFAGIGPWAHVDMVSARASASTALSDQGATGFGVRLLVDLAAAAS